MISIPFLICVIGGTVSLIFTKWKKVEDKWVADHARLVFFVGLFWTVAPYAGKLAW